MNGAKSSPSINLDIIAPRAGHSPGKEAAAPASFGKLFQKKTTS
jgi:hypothetical protein